MKKILSFVLGIGLIWFLGKAVLWGIFHQNPEINYQLPEKFSGVMIVHGSNTVVNRTEGSNVFVTIDSKGQGTVNRKYIIERHSVRFSDGGRSFREWIEKEYPRDTKCWAFSISYLNLKLLPADVSDAYFVGTASEFKAFKKTHPED